MSGGPEERQDERHDARHDLRRAAHDGHRPDWSVDPPAGTPDRELVDQVHPPAWTNPEPPGRYHLVVVGAGTAGLISAAGAAGLGARVALVERALMGGDCLNVGCVPSKGILRAARAWHDARRAAERFGGPAVRGGEADGGDGTDFAAAMERMREIRADISHHDSAERYTELGVDVYLGQGRFTGPGTLAVDGGGHGDATLHFRRAVVATGARAAAPPIDGLEEAGYLTNESVFDLRELPACLAVIGGGPIGCELAQAFARFGSRVTLLDMADHVLVREDADAARAVQRSMVADGVELELGVEITGVRRDGAARVISLRRDGEAGEVVADAVLVAVGRAPNVDGLGLDKAQVRYDAKTGVEVDDRLRTSNPRIFACGDVASKYQFTHMADAEARIVIQNALFFGRKKASDLVVPWCTYTSPEVAHVGLYAADAEARGIEVETLTVPLQATDRAKLDGDEGFLRVHLAAGSDEIVGATLVSEHAGETLSELTLAITAGVGLGKIAEVIHPYPTQAEVIKRAADQWRRGKLTPTVSKLFRGWFRVFR